MIPRGSLGALRRRLSPGLPLSHTSKEACDPAVLILCKDSSSVMSPGTLTLTKGDDHLTEL